MEPVSLATAAVALLVPFVKGTVAKLADRAGEVPLAHPLGVKAFELADPLEWIPLA